MKTVERPDEVAYISFSERAGVSKQFHMLGFSADYGDVAILLA